ncbi:hypothetical protein [Massilia litorea]|uniref:Uncharacterized protein n=1 Tax=Massilia litorea TaxID=2769491 RepID=A0A7L9U0M7_9BURK|nr:hypothetical protein [Massilia litorea]QOL48498.1 hypothetical protein LPB04_16185 [Massilia litorea]
MMHTAPDEILREVRDLHQFILALLASPDKTRWHWPSYYLLYVDMDRMAWRLRGTRTVFADEPLFGKAAGFAAGPRPVAGQAEAVDDAFADLGKAQGSIVGRLWHMSRNTLTVIEDKQLRQRMRAHLHPKSEWYQVFRSDYCPGRVSADGRTLERSILKTDPEPPDRIHDLGETNLHVHQTFDIGTDAARNLLAQAVARVEDEHARVSRAMADCFLAHCSLEALLHPSSV